MLWAACGAMIAVGRKLWSIETTLRVYLAAAPVLAFLAAAGHGRAAAITILAMPLDPLVVAPFFERS
jgi:hypothetical protein